MYYFDVVYVFPADSFSVNSKGNTEIYNNKSTKCTRLVIYTFTIISMQ
jgi:hypothetical protein